MCVGACCGGVGCNGAYPHICHGPFVRTWRCVSIASVPPAIIYYWGTSPSALINGPRAFPVRHRSSCKRCVIRAFAPSQEVPSQTQRTIAPMDHQHVATPKEARLPPDQQRSHCLPCARAAMRPRMCCPRLPALTRPWWRPSWVRAQKYRCQCIYALMTMK